LYGVCAASGFAIPGLGHSALSGGVLTQSGPYPSIKTAFSVDMQNNYFILQKHFTAAKVLLIL